MFGCVCVCVCARVLIAQRGVVYCINSGLLCLQCHEIRCKSVGVEFISIELAKGSQAFLLFKNKRKLRCIWLIRKCLHSEAEGDVSFILTAIAKMQRKIMKIREQWISLFLPNASSVCCIQHIHASYLSAYRLEISAHSFNRFSFVLDSCLLSYCYSDSFNFSPFNSYRAIDDANTLAHYTRLM